MRETLAANFDYALVPMGWKQLQPQEHQFNTDPVDDWVEWLAGTYAPAGMNHALVSFADPFTLEAWADREIEGLPSLVEQVRLFGEQVLPRIA